jgi:hypothetical protein
VAVHLPVLVSLAVLAALLIALNVVEWVRFRVDRDVIRHGESH